MAPDAFVDRKNAPVTLNAGEPRPPWGSGPSWEWSAPEWELPEINTQIQWDLDLSIGRPVVDGYDYQQTDQPVPVECWVEIAGELEAELAPFREEMDDLRPQVERIVDEVEIVLPERPVGEIAEVDEDGWLFDAGRDYFDQLGAYRAHKAGGAS